MGKKDYSELLKHPKWQKRRLEIFERDNFTCQKCGATEETLHIHHLKYLKNALPWESPSEDLITLCEICHSWVSYMKLTPDEFQDMKVVKYCDENGTPEGFFLRAKFMFALFTLNDGWVFGTSSEWLLNDIIDLVNGTIKNIKNGQKND